MGFSGTNLFSRMVESAKQFFISMVRVEKNERVKVLMLTLAFFCVIAAYTIVKDFKDAIFASVVGKEYLPEAKWATMFVIVPAILLYSKLVDKLRRYQLLCAYSFVYSMLGLIFAYWLGDPQIGVLNTQTSPYRLFGWIFYFYVEGYSPFIVSLFWAFANSITNPNSAKRYYGMMVSGSKLGGMISAGLAWMLLCQKYCVLGLVTSDVGRLQFLLVMSSVMLLFVPLAIIIMMRSVSGHFLHGYEAAYRLEKERAKEGKSETGVFAGLNLFVKYPYLLGIFCMVFFYEVVNTILGYQRVSIAQASSENVAEMSGFLLKIMFLTHLVGFVISLLGTRALLERLGERICLILIPAATGIALFYFMWSYNEFALLATYVIMRGINYGFSYPVRESLYIPTVKEIKFKSKSWIDAFGTKFAKGTGAAVNKFTQYLPGHMILSAYSLCFASVIGLWLLAAMLLGRRFDRAVKNNEVIGSDEVLPDKQPHSVS